MKNIYFLLAASVFIASCGPTTVIHSDPYPPPAYQPPPAAPPVVEVSYQSFYDQLSPYGNWINYPGYGYVWSPNAGPDFHPYASNGNWIYTDAGWTWASNYNWGWAPFHYGRWFYENGYGWMWVPGSEWAPAWVSWRGGGDYYGWAPLGPSISVDVALNNYNPPPYYWNFVPCRYMGNPNWHNYYVDGGRNVTIINNTTIINNYSGTNRGRYAYAPGPDPGEVRRYSGNNFTPVQLRQSSTPGARMSGTQYEIYQPRVNARPAAQGNSTGRPSNPAPVRYESFNNMRPSTQYQANQTANNPRPAMQNPGNQPVNNQPVNNPRPAMQNPANTLPVNNQPVNNPRPAMQNPGNNQPVNNQPANNPRPAMQNPGNQPVNNQPVNNPRPAMQNPGNQPVNNQPVNNPRPGMQNPGNNQPTNNRPVNNQPGNNPPVNSARPTNPNPNDPRSDRYNPNSSNSHPAQNNAAAQHPPVNPAQTTGRPAVDHNPNDGHPVQRTATPPGTAKPEQKPSEKPTEKPKTRQANDNE